MTPEELDQLVSLIEEEDLDGLIATTIEEVTMQVAIDSGSCANVANPEDLPPNCTITPKEPHEKDFHGAGGDRIKKY